MRALRKLGAAMALAVLAQGASLAHAATTARPPAEPSAAAGRFSAQDLPADRDGSSLLTIPAPGRYAVAARSASGVAIQIVDMIAGPGETAGAAGQRDGRLDLFLDAGVYKIRLFGAKGASGKARLSAEGFRELNAPRRALAAGQTESAELGDLAQRGYEVEVDASGRVAIEALGRSLRDLRLWRTSGELVDLSPSRAAVETRPGRPLTRLRLEGAVPPGRYVAVAYGGEALVWPEGGAAQPFLLRLIEPLSLAAGVVEGAIGPFGSIRLEAPASYDTFRLELPQFAAARLEARRGEGALASAAIDKKSREPLAVATLGADGKTAGVVEISGLEGQTFSLRALRRSSRAAIEEKGRHLVALDVAGEGADEVPATALLARGENGRTRVLAADLPRIGRFQPFRRKFNLRGPTTLLFEAIESGPVEIKAIGPRLRALIQPAFGVVAPRADGRAPTRYDLQAGFYSLSLEPIDGAVGIVDLTLGAPGAVVEEPPPPPARSIISFGEQKLDRTGAYFILSNAAPGLLAGPRVIALPAELGKGPAPLWQAAATEYLVPIVAPRAGRILLVDESGASVEAPLAEERIENDRRIATVRVPARDRAGARAIVLAPDPAAAGAGASAADRPPTPIDGKRAAYFDLAGDETRDFRFEIPEGGLYRIETLGRLRTRLRLGAALVPALGEAQDNGPGHNALLSAYLRAGSYRAAVTALRSAGHLGLKATPTGLAPTAPIVGEGAARAALEGGRGAIVPIDIAESGLYRLDLQGLDKEWRARLEEADGWPLTTQGPLTRLVRRFEPGSYRLVVLPRDVEGRVLARLRKIETKAPLEGHGPHALPFEAPQKLQWREPRAEGPRAPDVWTFALAGAADVDIDIGEGMIAEIFREGGDSVGKFAAGRKFSGRLAAGAYRIEARSLAHDDRLDYEIRLSSKQLQPGAPRFAKLPAAIPFAIARDRIVDMASFGDTELIGAIEDESGAVVERLQGRAEDWNVSVSRRLPAGAYVLRLDALKGKPKLKSEPAPRPAPKAQDEEEGETGEARPAAASAAPEAVADPEGVEIRLSLPASTPAEALTLSGVRTIAGAGAHELALPAAPEGRLALVAARSTREIVLSIETREANGGWRAIGQDRGLAPVVAWPAAPGERRATVWTVGGEAAPITLAARLLERTPRGLGEIALEPAPIEGLGPSLCVGLAAAPGGALVEIGAAPASLAAGATPGAPLAPAGAGPLAPQSELLWLLSRGECPRLAVTPLAVTSATIALTLGAGERAVLPAAPPPAGKARLWLARSAFGQPGIVTGRGVAVAPGAALALVGQESPRASPRESLRESLRESPREPPRLSNAGDAGPLRLDAQAIDVALAAPLRAGALFAGVIPPFTAQPVTLEGAPGALSLDLASGLAAFAAPGEARAFGAFADGAPLSRRLDGARALWLVNVSDRPAPARLALTGERFAPLAAGGVLKRFFGAAGDISLPVAAEPGDRLGVAGGEATFVGANGSVARGASVVLGGPGEAVIAHPAGLVAAWIERGGKSPWPAPPPRPVAAPFETPLTGEAQAFALDIAAPVMVDIRTSAPAIVAFSQNGARVVEAFPAGVELHRHAAPGRALVEIFSPQDGPLAGALTLATTPVIPVTEGVNEEVALGPGGTALFSFETMTAGEIGLGLRAEPDRARLRLFDAKGATLGEGPAQIARLEPGRYFVEARAPADAPTTVLRLALRGLSPPPAGPPPEVVAEFAETARRK